MGSQQSKLDPEAAAHEKAVLDRLRDMRFESQEGGDYVHVHGTADEKGARVVREAETLSVDETQEWQKRLLEDPKNR